MAPSRPKNVLDISFLRTLSTNPEYIITARIPKYMYDQNTYYVLPLFFLRVLFYKH